MNNLALRYFRLSGDWRPLFERLPSWRLQADSKWTDGNSVVEMSEHFPSAPEFGFTVNDETDWAKLRKTSRGSVETQSGNNGSTEVRVITPSGVSTSFRRQTREAKRFAGESIVMNHVAVNVTALASEERWYESLFGDYMVLARASAWEPVSRKYVRDVHLFSSPEFYITLRETSAASGVDHVGWMTKDPPTVNDMAALVKRLGWRIIFGPAEIDGSYLFHFVGPDERVHDFFFPTAGLLQSRSRRHELECV